jgi:hypothetical protein
MYLIYCQASECKILVACHPIVPYTLKPKVLSPPLFHLPGSAIDMDSSLYIVPVSPLYDRRCKLGPLFWCTAIIAQMMMIVRDDDGETSIIQPVRRSVT